MAIITCISPIYGVMFKHRSASGADRQDPAGWATKAIINVAGSGRFSTDRTITEYASEIWDAKPCPVP